MDWTFWLLTAFNVLTIICCMLFYYYVRTLKVLALNARLEIVEKWIEIEAEHRDRQERGRYGAEVKAEMKQQSEMAFSEGRQVLLSPGSNEEKQAAFIKLIQKYPNVAVGVARRLNRQYGISRFLGINEDELIQHVIQIAATTAQQPTSEEGLTL